MPEIGYQLHNYADQIQNWGWIYNIHSQASRSFTRNVNLIHKQPTSVTLLAVVATGRGACYVTVDDNGSGVSRDGLELMGEIYARFGFTGDALSSISDVSLLEIVTKAHGRPHGYYGKCLYLGVDDCSQDVGTTVIVRDVF